MGCKQVESKKIIERKRLPPNPQPNLNKPNKVKKKINSNTNEENPKNEQPINPSKISNVKSNPPQNNNDEIKENESQHENQDINNNNNIIDNQPTEINNEQHNNNEEQNIINPEPKKSNLSVKNNNIEENQINKSIHQDQSEPLNENKASIIISRQDDKMNVQVKSSNNNILKDWSSKVGSNSKIGEVISSFNKDTSNNIPPDSIKINQQVIPPGTLIKSLIPDNKNEIVLEVGSLCLPDLTENYQREIATNTNMLGKLIDCNNELRLLIFYRKTHGFSSNQIKNQDLINETQINLFSKLSALCNGNNILYISGGEDDNCIPMKHFWKIDLTTEHITLHSKGMPSGKRSHSMIFIPHKYVFIIGGIDKNVYYYINDSDSFEQWIPLEEDLIEPALAYINNSYLFAFSNSIKNDNTSFHFHRTNLKETPKWQIIHPILENDSLQFNQKFFGCCYDYKDNKVIFFGGNKFGINQSVINDSNSIAYDWNENKLVDSNIKHIECDLDEKTFLPFNDKYSFILPSLSRKKINFYFYNNVTKEFKSMNFFSEKELSKKKSQLGTPNDPAQSVNQQIRGRDKIANKMLASDNININQFGNKLQNSKYCFNMPMWSKRIDVPKEVNVNENKEEVQEHEPPKLNENEEHKSINLLNFNSHVKQSVNKSSIHGNGSNDNDNNFQVLNVKSQMHEVKNVINESNNNDYIKSKIMSNSHQNKQDQLMSFINKHPSMLVPIQFKERPKQSELYNNNNVQNEMKNPLDGDNNNNNINIIQEEVSPDIDDDNNNNNNNNQDEINEQADNNNNDDNDYDYDNQSAPPQETNMNEEVTQNDNEQNVVEEIKVTEDGDNQDNIQNNNQNQNQLQESTSKIIMPLNNDNQNQLQESTSKIIMPLSNSNQLQLQESTSKIIMPLNNSNNNNNNNQNKENNVNKDTFNNNNNIHKSFAIKLPQNKDLPQINRNNPKHTSVMIGIKPNPK